MIDGVELTAKVEFLRSPDAYPERPTRIDVVETHMSWVFLTDAFAYKLKKPVQLPFLNFTTLAARRFACEESIRLNRRLAPEVYLGVVALCRAPGGGLQLEGEGEPIEWLEKMRRLPAERLLDRAIEDGHVRPEHVKRFSRVLGAFYRSARPEPFSGSQLRERLSMDIAADHEALSQAEWGLPAARLDALRDAQQRALQRHALLFDSRAESGHIVEGHGDLRPEHVCLIEPPVIIDCLEFNRALRILDPVDELAYLALECQRLGAAWIEPLVFETYAKETHDSPPCEIVSFYKVRRAVLRAKLAIWHLRDHDPSHHVRWRERALAYLTLAERHAAG